MQDAAGSAVVTAAQPNGGSGNSSGTGTLAQLQGLKEVRDKTAELDQLKATILSVRAELDCIAYVSDEARRDRDELLIEKEALAKRLLEIQKDLTTTTEVQSRMESQRATAQQRLTAADEAYRPLLADINRLRHAQELDPLPSLEREQDAATAQYLEMRLLQYRAGADSRTASPPMARQTAKRGRGRPRGRPRGSGTRRTSERAAAAAAASSSPASGSPHPASAQKQQLAADTPLEEYLESGSNETDATAEPAPKRRRGRPRKSIA